MSLALDGNAIAGPLYEFFGQEMTTATGTCRHCGQSSLIAELRVYSRGPGDVVRCRSCGQVVIVLAVIRGTLTVDLGDFRLTDPIAP
jgi:ribosomal protein S27AE